MCYPAKQKQKQLIIQHNQIKEGSLSLGGKEFLAIHKDNGQWKKIGPLTNKCFLFGHGHGSMWALTCSACWKIMWWVVQMGHNAQKHKHIWGPFCGWEFGFLQTLNETILMAIWATHVGYFGPLVLFLWPKLLTSVSFSLIGHFSFIFFLFVQRKWHCECKTILIPSLSNSIRKFLSIIFSSFQLQ